MQRPSGLKEYIGQERFKQRLGISIESAKKRDEPHPHTLIYGESGYGKTSVAEVIAKELGRESKTIVCNAIGRVEDVFELCIKMQKNQVLILDEIHRLRVNVEEAFYTVLEDNKLTYRNGSDVITVNTESFTVIGCTTNYGAVSEPLRTRFELTHELDPYTNEELTKIVQAYGKKISIDLSDKNAMEIAKRSRGVPRNAVSICNRIRDCCVAQAKEVTSGIKTTFEIERIDENGVNQTDMKYLNLLKDKGLQKSVGVNNISRMIGLDKQTIESTIEPHLLRLKLIEITPKGRKVTAKGLSYGNRNSITTK